MGNAFQAYDDHLDESIFSENLNFIEEEIGKIDEKATDVAHVIKDLDAYIHELKQHAAVAPCDETLSIFVAQEFSSTTCSLKVKCFPFNSSGHVHIPVLSLYVNLCHCKISYVVTTQVSTTSCIL